MATAPYGCLPDVDITDDTQVKFAVFAYDSDGYYGENSQIEYILNYYPSNPVAFYVTMEDLETPGYLDANGFTCFIYSRDGQGFGYPLTETAANNVKNWVTGNVCLFMSDISDLASGMLSTEAGTNSINLIWGAAKWCSNKGFIGELKGGAAGLTTNSQGFPALAFFEGEETGINLIDPPYSPHPNDTGYRPSLDYHPIYDGNVPTQDWRPPIPLDEIYLASTLEFYCQSTGVTASLIQLKTNNSPSDNLYEWPVIITNPFGLDENGDEVNCAGGVTVNINASIYNIPAGGADTPTQLGLWYMNKDPEYVTPYARYITTYQDLDSVNWKHIKYVDVIGDYGTNSVTLKWDKSTVYNNWSSLGVKYPDTIGYDQATRWYNLGQARRVAFMLDWSGDSNIAHDAIEVIYNIRTQ